LQRPSGASGALSVLPTVPVHSSIAISSAPATAHYIAARAHDDSPAARTGARCLRLAARAADPAMFTPRGLTPTGRLTQLRGGTVGVWKRDLGRWAAALARRIDSTPLAVSLLTTPEFDPVAAIRVGNAR